MLGEICQKQLCLHVRPLPLCGSYALALNALLSIQLEVILNYQSLQMNCAVLIINLLWFFLTHKSKYTREIRDHFGFSLNETQVIIRCCLVACILSYSVTIRDVRSRDIFL